MADTAQTTDSESAPKGLDLDFVKEFMTQRQGRWVVLYSGLLHLAHERGLVGIETEMLQYPSEENHHTAIAKARVTMDQDGKLKSYTGIGDANPGNVAKPMAIHTIRMAETRSKSRALRDAVDIGVAALEELADADEGTVNQARGAATGGQPQAQARPQQPQRQAPAQPQRPQQQAQQPANGQPATIRVKARGQEFVVPDTFAEFTTDQIDAYAVDALLLWQAQTPDALRAAWETVNGNRAMMPEEAYKQLGRIKDQVKKRLSQQPAPAGKGQSNGR